jgi:hypothetical protein
MNIELKYRDHVLAIWKKYQNLPFLNESNCEYRKSPLLPSELTDNAILFIGINPAFKKGDTVADEYREIEFYLQNENHVEINYFQRFKEIADYCGERWTHIDMLFVRETDQSQIDKLSYTTEGINFIQDQIEFAFQIIEESQPKLILVSNAFATELFGKKKAKHQVFDKIWKGYSLDFEKDFDAAIGTYTIEINGKPTPIIFSGMLSGQRALDNGSFERLKWQMKWILQKSK